MNKHAEKSKTVHDVIGYEEFLKLNKDYPFRIERDEAIKKLYQRGVQVVVISSISGLSVTSIDRIISGRPFKYQTRCVKIENAGSAQAAPAP